ncbi:thiol-disulfide isomerase [Chitinophaga caeni]|uniref:Thiol-disulfide isomerase n=1 Tax=Chitinophaga caeni TaxID=2029983 RepID=A0A291QZG3_9BACT|nr:thioredoxin family protein [Chitinophaga caeni]ATL49234.1 thiol-disulfide isomerase [Chitinophaga caeni]
MKWMLATALLYLLPNTAWLGNIQEAKTTATKEHKLILLNFSGSDWCGPCIRLTKDVFESENFSNYAKDNLVLVRADFPRQKKHRLDKEQVKRNEQMADQYNPNGIFPYTLLLDENGKILKSWEGNPGLDADEMIAAIKSVKDGDQ